MTEAVCTSSAANGSSSSRTSGSAASARASATRCCCPPDSCSRTALLEAAELDRGQPGRRRAGAAASRGLPCDCGPKATLSTALRCGNSSGSWPSSPMARRSGGTAAARSPATWRVRVRPERSPCRSLAGAGRRARAAGSTCRNRSAPSRASTSPGPAAVRRPGRSSPRRTCSRASSVRFTGRPVASRA